MLNVNIILAFVCFHTTIERMPTKVHRQNKKQYNTIINDNRLTLVDSKHTEM